MRPEFLKWPKASLMTTRPTIMGRKGMVTSGHYLASMAGFNVLKSGGNAIDAAVAACFCINLLEPQNNGIGGEVPILIYIAEQKKVVSISGVGWSAEDFTIDWCRENNVDMIPGDGYLPACVPAVVDSWAQALARYGTMSFSQVLSFAIDLAENGFPLDRELHNSLNHNKEKFLSIYPSSADVYLSGDNPIGVGEIFTNPGFADTLKRLCDVENRAKKAGRVAGIEAASREFYEGSIVESILEFTSKKPLIDSTGTEHPCLLKYSDFATWHAQVEESVSTEYKDLTVHKCSSWTQGPVFLQQLKLLELVDLKELGHNSVDYIHTLTEIAKLSFADREAYYGDPDFDSVPLDKLLSETYNNDRINLVEEFASDKMNPGNLGSEISYNLSDILADNRQALGSKSKEELLGRKHGHAHMGDTTHLDVIDSQGNMVAATPSGGWIGTSPVIPGLGFPIGTRGQQFFLNPNRPNALEPHKRPRTTLTPTLVTKNDEPFMVLGTPGGDTQDQATLQFFLNYIEFGMDMQEALDQPTFYSAHFPSSFYPRAMYPKRIYIEERVEQEIIEGLEKKGHEVICVDPWSTGKVMGLHYNSKTKVISGACSPRRTMGYVIGD